MTSVQPVVFNDLRVIMCLAFDHRASACDVAAFKRDLIKWEQVVSCCDLTGTFDFLLEAALPDLASYTEKLEQLRNPLARLVSRYEANFVCKRYVRVLETNSERTIWVPWAQGLKRLDCSSIDKVSAEGDYMRIHAGAASYMVHDTMRGLAEKLGAEDFVAIHRSVLIRCAAVERVLHEGRRWSARLKDGSVERVARSHVAELMAKLRTDPAIPLPSSPKTSQLITT